jgi:cyclophilin family peptidyl-prolyl cis-trans isomerase
MPSRARDRQLAKTAERRRLEKQRARRNRQAGLGVGIVVAIVLVALLVIGLLSRDESGTSGASATPSAPASATAPRQTGTVPVTGSPASTVACGAKRPATADQPKPQFDRAPTPKEVLDKNTTYTAVLETSCGTIKVALDSQAAPQTVANFVFLAEQGYYDGTFFHRVVDSIDVIQGGNPSGGDPTAPSGPGYTIPDELTGKERYAPGTMAMANAGPNTGGSQFFIITGAEGANLDGNPSYTIFGQVTEGLQVAQQINSFMKTTDGSYDGPPTEAVYIDRITIERSKQKPSPSATP